MHNNCSGIVKVTSILQADRTGARQTAHPRSRLWAKTYQPSRARVCNNRAVFHFWTASRSNHTNSNHGRSGPCIFLKLDCSVLTNVTCRDRNSFLTQDPSSCCRTVAICLDRATSHLHASQGEDYKILIHPIIKSLSLLGISLRTLSYKSCLK